MTHRSVPEWGHVPIDGGEAGFAPAQADALHRAACAHPLAHAGGGNILGWGRGRLEARQMVGMIAARGCSLEILPKLDGGEEGAPAIRQRLVGMLDVALGLDLHLGGPAAMARQEDTLLDILIRQFADALLAEVRRGLPHAYHPQADDLPHLRGRMDPQRQFTGLLSQPGRLACRFDERRTDTPLLRIMAAAVVFLGKHCRVADTQRRLTELRHRLADVPATPVARLPWGAVRIDRASRRWAGLARLARLLLRGQWQGTGHAADAPEGLALLFPMNDLFERYIAALVRRALAGSGVEVVAQGGLRPCLGDWAEGEPCRGTAFQTRPDLLLRAADGRVLAVIDTKWKRLEGDPLSGKGGAAQGDVYQMMAYARLYACQRLMLLYPAVPDELDGERRVFGIAGGTERLSVATVDVARPEAEVVDRLRRLAQALGCMGGLRGPCG